MTVSKIASNEIYICSLHADLVCNQIKKILEEVRGAPDLQTTLLWFIESSWAKKQASWPFSTLPMLTSQLVGGDIEVSAHLATAWNLFYLAAHIFDDIEDEGRVIGPNGVMPLGEAVNVATTFLFLAQLALDSLSQQGVTPSLVNSLRHDLNQVLTQMCIGQHRDLVELTRPEISLDAYWEVAAAKSGSFFGWACRAGAAVAGGSPSQVESCDAYGYNLGLLLQISDDWADLWTNEGASDLTHCKKTLAVIYALEVSPPEGKKRLVALLDKASRSREAEAAIQTEIIRLGGLYYTLVEAEMRYKCAEAALLAAAPSGQIQRYLLALLNLASPLPRHKQPFQ